LGAAAADLLPPHAASGLLCQQRVHRAVEHRLPRKSLGLDDLHRGTHRDTDRLARAASPRPVYRRPIFPWLGFFSAGVEVGSFFVRRVGSADHCRFETSDAPGVNVVLEDRASHHRQLRRVLADRPNGVILRSIVLQEGTGRFEPARSASRTWVKTPVPYGVTVIASRTWPVGSTEIVDLGRPLCYGPRPKFARA
jgi:hypothetical protein